MKNASPDGMTIFMKIRDRLPKKEPREPIQVKVPLSLLVRVRKQIEKDDITLTDLVIACLEAYLEESKK